MIPTLAVDALAAFRLTRLVTADVLTEEPRMELVKLAYDRAGRALPPTAWDATAAEMVAADPDPPKLAYLLSCPWCSGFYVALAVTLARALAPRPWAFVARALALSAAAGLLSSLEDR